MSNNNSNNNITPQRLLERAEVMPNGCIEWQRARSAYGYGVVSFQNQVMTVNRLMLILLFGEPATKSVAMHLCDNPPCINPSHLRWGTHAENSQDMVAKNRRKSNPVTGIRHHNAKLNPELVAQIRSAHKQGFTQTELAQAFSVSKSTIGNIVHYRIWK